MCRAHSCREVLKEVYDAFPRGEKSIEWVAALRGESTSARLALVPNFSEVQG